MSECVYALMTFECVCVCVCVCVSVCEYVSECVCRAGLVIGHTGHFPGGPTHLRG